MQESASRSERAPRARGHAGHGPGRGSSGFAGDTGEPPLPRQDLHGEERVGWSLADNAGSPPSPCPGLGPHGATPFPGRASTPSAGGPSRKWSSLSPPRYSHHGGCEPDEMGSGPGLARWGDGCGGKPGSPGDDPALSCLERHRPPPGASAEHEIRGLALGIVTGPVAALSVWRHSCQRGGAYRAALTHELLDGGLLAGDVLESISCNGEAPVVALLSTDSGPESCGPHRTHRARRHSRSWPRPCH